MLEHSVSNPQPHDHKPNDLQLSFGRVLWKKVENVCSLPFIWIKIHILSQEFTLVQGMQGGFCVSNQQPGKSELTKLQLLGQ